MNSDLTSLVALQQADSEIARLTAEIAALPKRVAEIETKLAGARRQMEDARAAVKADEQVRRKCEGEIQAQQQKISKYRDQMLEVKTNGQYKALVHEVEFAEKQIRSFEDKILETMLDADEKDKVVKSAEAELKAQTTIIEKEKIEAKTRTEEDEKQLAEWGAKRDQLRAGINSDSLRHYDRVLRLRGTALAEARGHKCSVCQVMLRPQMWNEVRSGDSIVACDSCQRILWYDPSKEPAEPPPVDKRERTHRGRMNPQKSWFYLPQFEDAGEVFVAYINDSEQSSRRVYDADTGRRVGESTQAPGDFKSAFAAELARGIWLRGDLDAQQLDEWGELPTGVIIALQAELQNAHAEAQANAVGSRH